MAAWPLPPYKLKLPEGQFWKADLDHFSKAPKGDLLDDADLLANYFAQRIQGVLQQASLVDGFKVPHIVLFPVKPAHIMLLPRQDRLAIARQVRKYIRRGSLFKDNTAARSGLQNFGAGERYWCVLVLTGVLWWCMGLALPITEPTRRSVTIPGKLAAKIDMIADHRHVTSNRVILDLIEDGIAAYDRRRAAFLELTERFQKSTDPAETERLREELIRITFGD